MSDRDYNLRIREATSHDRDQVISLIDAVYREYGDQIWLTGADADLLEIPQYYQRQQGNFWVLVDAHENVWGTHAAFSQSLDAVSSPTDSPTTDQPPLRTCGFRRLYLVPELRGTQWGHRLMQLTIDWAWQSEFDLIEFWSDTRFHRAHRFFEKFGFRKDGRQRTMHDGHQPYQEYYYSLANPG